jgi:hypothetical protein
VFLAPSIINLIEPAKFYLTISYFASENKLVGAVFAAQN